MSGHGKQEEQYVYDNEGVLRQNPIAGYHQPFSQPTLTPHEQQPPDSRELQAHQFHGAQAASSPTYSSTHTFQPRDVHLQHHSFITSTRPDVLSYSPHYGLSGPGVRRQATVSKVASDYADGYYYYDLDATAPPFDTNLSPGTQVPLALNLEDDYGRVLDTVKVGDFTFAASAPTPAYSFTASSIPDMLRKRKQSAEPSEFLLSPPKRTASRQNIERINQPSTGYQAAQSQMSPYLRAASSEPYGLAQPSTSPQMYNQPSVSEQQYQYPQMLFPQQATLMTPPGLSTSPYAQTLPRTPVTIPIAPLLPQVPQVMTIGYSTAAISSTAPTLVRTAGTRPPSSALTAVVGVQQAFNPYSMYPTSKAVLKLEGSLESMSEGWTDDELQANRRLVEFQRNQIGSNITATFKAVTPEERTANSICVSCILWEDKGECFVTSVDTIYLLESLVAVRFTLQEKNRIRRNLEGFHPRTVSKGKSDTAEFFKIIMLFPNPKPRSIEKDIKIFPWRILSHALKKIVGKYTASYASTAGALLPPAGPSYSSSAQPSRSDESAELHHRVSKSPSTASVTSPPQRAGSITTAARSPNPSIPGSMSRSRTASHDVRSGGLSQSANVLGQALYGVAHGIPDIGHTHWTTIQQQQQQQQPSHQTSQFAPAMPQSGRDSWDSFMPASFSTMAATPGSAQQMLPYHRRNPSSILGDGKKQQQEDQQGQQYAGQSSGKPYRGYGTGTGTGGAGGSPRNPQTSNA